MIESTVLLRLAAYWLGRYMSSGVYAENFDSKELADIVIVHAAAAGISAMAAGALPGVGSIIASGLAVGAIWTMYAHIGKYLHLKISKDLWKAIASAVLANVVTQLAGVLALEMVVGFIPGAGIIAAGAVNFGVTYVAGLIFLKALTEIFKAGKNPEQMTGEQMKKQFSDAAKTVNVRSAFSEAKSAFNEMKKDGSLNEKGKKVDIDSRGFRPDLPR